MANYGATALCHEAASCMTLEAKIELFQIVPHCIVFTPCELFSEGDWDPKRNDLADWIPDMCTWRVYFKTSMEKFGYEPFHASFLLRC